MDLDRQYPRPNHTLVDNEETKLGENLWKLLSAKVWLKQIANNLLDLRLGKIDRCRECCAICLFGTFDDPSMECQQC